MKLQFAVLANYAEERGGLLNLMGAAWDTLNVHSDPPPALPGVAVLTGFLVARFLVEAADRTRELRLVAEIAGPSGQTIAQLSDGPQLNVGTGGDTDNWQFGANLVLGLAGVIGPEFGAYEIRLKVGGQWFPPVRFRVIDRRMPGQTDGPGEHTSGSASSEGLG